MPEQAYSFLGTDPKLRRMLGYWAATGLLYLLAIALLQVQMRAGTAVRDWGTLLCWFYAGGVLLCFVLVRAML